MEIGKYQSDSHNEQNCKFNFPCQTGECSLLLDLYKMLSFELNSNKEVKEAHCIVYRMFNYILWIVS